MDLDYTRCTKKIIIAIPLTDSTTTEVAKGLDNNFISIHGISRIITFDQGSHFCNKVIQELSRIFKIEKLRSTASSFPVDWISWNVHVWFWRMARMAPLTLPLMKVPAIDFINFCLEQNLSSHRYSHPENKFYYLITT